LTKLLIHGLLLTISSEPYVVLSEIIIVVYYNCNLAYGLDWHDSKLRENLSSELMKLVAFYVENNHVKPCSMLDMMIGTVGYDSDYVKWCGAGT